MKSTFKSMVAAIAAVSLMSCGGESTETTTDTTGTTSDASMTTTTDVTATSSVTPGKYIDLSTGKEVEIDRDATSGRWVDKTSRTPVEYYISLDNRDTFDTQGRNVNNALDRSTDGKYMVNEGRLRVKMDSDGDMKIKDGDETKMKYDKSSDELKFKNDTMKEKDNGNQ